MASETVVTSKGNSPIPPKIRRQAGIRSSTVINWTLRSDGVIVLTVARKENGTANEAQRHIRSRSGKWDGKVSGTELLRRTRP
jgi:bifunctional DNA-binding transcriptional regulator/antitoxin component of YhaV-PrlF toxin-antitoxin module